MKHLASIIIACVIGTSAGQAQTKTLSECISIGIDNNLMLNNALTSINKGQMAVTQNRSRLLPVIQGVAQFTDYLKSPVNVTTGTLLGNDFPEEPTWQTIKSMQYNTQAGIMLTVPIFNKTIFAGIDVAKTVEDISHLSYEAAKEALTVQIAKLYYMAQASKEQLRLSMINIDRMNELCEITEALYEQGVVMEVDLNRVKINSQMLLTEHSMQHTLHTQQLNMLRYLMDMPIEAPLDVEPIESTVAPISTASASRSLPELLLAEKQKALIDKQIKGIKAEYLPSLSLTGYAGGLGYNEKFSQFADNWFGNCYVGISLKVPIFDANSKKLRIRQHRYDAIQAQNNIDIQKKLIDKNYADALLQMNRNIEIASTQNKCREQAESVYKIAEEQYKEGIASMTSLLQDDMQLRTAQSSYIQAICQCKLAQLDLLKLSGQLNLLSDNRNIK